MPENDGRLYLGLMSGTSMDGIDAALVRFGDRTCEVVATLHCPYPDELRAMLVTASRRPQECNLDDIGILDHWVGESFRDAANELLAQANVEAKDVAAIGSHGQTLRHQPDVDKPFTLQIGDPNIIVAGTGITTVADFRRRDIAVGGQGAPLAPSFHRWLFGDSDKARVVVNIGGIANLTCLPVNGDVTGFDCGPGNTLLDAWHLKHRGTPFDKNGRWSVEGTVNEALLVRLRQDPFFAKAPPKSTGFEYFNLQWLERNLKKQSRVPLADVQSTLCELTASTIADAIENYFEDADEVLVCGGGVHNRDLMARLGNRVHPAMVHTTAAFGLDADWVEAAAFAWLAQRTVDRQAGNLPAVTGADEEVVLGGVYGVADRA